MKTNKNQSIGTVIFYIGLIIISCLLLTSCYTNKKAAEQVNKAIDKKPLVALPIFRGKFPCVVTGVTTTYDSSAYLASVDSVKQLADFYKELMDGIEPTYITKLDTVYLKECANYIKDIDRLKRLLIIQEKFNKELFEKTATTPPVIEKNREQVEDLSQVVEIDLKLTQALKERDELQAKNDRKGKTIKWLIFFVIGLSIPYILKAIKFFKP